MNLKRLTTILVALMFVISPLYSPSTYAADTGNIPTYDEESYTAYVEKTMKKLDMLYLDFCASCNVEASKAIKARQKYYATVRDLLKYMNTKFDRLDPKKGAALSPTEVLVNIHVLTMLVDILTATQMEIMADPSHY